MPPADAAALADCDAGNGDNGNVQRGFRRFKTTPDVSAPAPKKSPTVTRRSPGAPRQQSIQILEPEEVLEALNVPELRGRINSFSPPYSSHSQSAAGLIAAFALGGYLAFRLPPTPSQMDFDALRLWMLSAAAWVPLLGWVLWSDPRAPPPRKRSISGSVPNPIARCKHGCIFEVAPKTRHCRKCDKCVAGFDHHCLWLNTCVGRRNYHRWLLFLLLLCCWTMLTCWIAFSSLLRCRHLRSRRFAVGHRPAVLLLGLLAALATAWLVMLLVLHAYFNVMGITTLEWATSAPGAPVKPQGCQPSLFSIVNMRCCVPASALRAATAARGAPAPAAVAPAAPATVVSVNSTAKTTVVEEKSPGKLHWSKLRNAVLSEPSLSAPLSYNWRRRLSLSSVAVEETSESEEEDIDAILEAGRFHANVKRQHSA